jgi:rod shape-determining protein MreC
VGRDTRRTRILLAGLLVIALVLITIDVTAGKNTGGVRRVADNVFGPVERAAAAAVRPVRDAFTDSGATNRKTEALATENAALKRQLASTAEVKQQAAQLAQLGLVGKAHDFTLKPARVVATGDTTGTERTVDIGAGSSDGLKVGQLVIDTDGLVGVISRVSASVATVRLANDPRTVIGARLQGSKALGTISGTGSTGALSFTLYDPTLSVKPGDKVVTYGSADYAGGVPIGVTTAAGDLGTANGAGSLTQHVNVRPYVHFGTLDLVGVIVGTGS